MSKTKPKHQKTRFVAVGIVNTATGFGLLNLFYFGFGAGKFLANIIATVLATGVSYYLNRQFVFTRDMTATPYQQLLRFIVVSMIGSFVVLNGSYVLLIHLIEPYQATLTDWLNYISPIGLGHDFVLINASLSLAVVAAMTWNYNGYKYMVFRSSHD